MSTLPSIATSNATYADGALVDTVMPDSPASEAGLKPGDVTTSVSGESVKTSRDLGRAIGMTAPDKKVTLNIVRHQQPQKITLALGLLSQKT